MSWLDRLEHPTIMLNASDRTQHERIQRLRRQYADYDPYGISHAPSPADAGALSPSRIPRPSCRDGRIR